MAKEEVFLSYRREDTELIQPVRRAVQSAGFTPIGADDKRPSVAIPQSAYFVACFSANGHVDSELQIAVEQVQSGARDASWLLVVRLADAPIHGVGSLPGYVVRLADLRDHIAPATGDARVESRVEAGRAMGKRVQVVGVKGSAAGIRGQNVNSHTKVDVVTGDEDVLIGGVIITDPEDRK
ncbi:MAG TPA: toll/interleukin-1 receptor domain-containing protein [Thermoanaerobaculia bacterium]